LLEEHNRVAEAENEWNSTLEQDNCNAVLLESRGKFFLRRHELERGRLDFESVARNGGAAAHGHVLLAHLAKEGRY
jgi:hypothetical protein